MPANGHKAALPKPALAPRSRTRGGGSSSKKLAVYMLVGGASALMLIEARRLWPTVEESSVPSSHVPWFEHGVAAPPSHSVEQSAPT